MKLITIYVVINMLTGQYDRPVFKFPSLSACQQSISQRPLHGAANDLQCKRLQIYADGQDEEH